jgi:two-component system, chemotaxis family, CheB/CheR fusion protein
MPDIDDCERARILVVDDHPDTLMLMDRLLRMDGDYEVITAANSAEAIAAARGERLSLFIIDIGLPDGSGVALLGQLLKHGPCKALALTGYGMPSHIKQYKEAGFDEWLIKPIDFGLLLSTVERILADGQGD